MDNILLDEHFNFILADFGLATLMDGLLAGDYGTIDYKAPEINEEKEYDGKLVDAFSAGVTLFSVVTKFPPFCKQAT